MNIYWIPWLVGQFSPLFLKLGHYLWKADRSAVSFWRALGNFAFEDYDAAFRTILNLAIEFYLGAVYIDKLPAPYMPNFELPMHWAAVFGIAFSAELIIPLAVSGSVEWFKKKIKKWSDD